MEERYRQKCASFRTTTSPGCVIGQQGNPIWIHVVKVMLNGQKNFFSAISHTIWLKILTTFAKNLDFWVPLSHLPKQTLALMMPSIVFLREASSCKHSGKLSFLNPIPSNWKNELSQRKKTAVQIELFLPLFVSFVICLSNRQINIYDQGKNTLFNWHRCERRKAAKWMSETKLWKAGHLDSLMIFWFFFFSKFYSAQN